MQGNANSNGCCVWRAHVADIRLSFKLHTLAHVAVIRSNIRLRTFGQCIRLSLRQHTLAHVAEIRLSLRLWPFRLSIKLSLELRSFIASNILVVPLHAAKLVRGRLEPILAK